jgi:hypothetical protein
MIRNFELGKSASRPPCRLKTKGKGSYQFRYQVSLACDTTVSSKANSLPNSLSGMIVRSLPQLVSRSTGRCERDLGNLGIYN